MLIVVFAGESSTPLVWMGDLPTHIEGLERLPLHDGVCALTLTFDCEGRTIHNVCGPFKLESMSVDDLRSLKQAVDSKLSELEST